MKELVGVIGRGDAPVQRTSPFLTQDEIKRMYFPSPYEYETPAKPRNETRKVGEIGYS